MLSPVVIGVKKSVADRFGWTDNPNVTVEGHPGQVGRRLVPLRDDEPGRVQQRVDRPDRRRVGPVRQFATRSTPGRSTRAALRAFFKGQTLTAGSSGFLADSVRP